MYLSQKSDSRAFSRSPFFYVGDKYKILGQITPHFPARIDRFIEPFTGGGSVAMNTRAKEYLLNDLDSNIVDVHKTLAGYSKKPEDFYKTVDEIIGEYGLSRSYAEDVIPEQLKRLWRKTYYAKYNKAGYDLLKSNYNSGEIKSPAVLYLLLIYGFNRMIRFNKAGNFNLPVGNVDFNTNVVRALTEYFIWSSSSDVKWHNLDYSDFLQSIVYGEGDFVYLDPPYLITFSEYNKLWSDESEKRLLELLDKLGDRGISFAISNVTHYKGRVNEIFLDWASRYNTHSVKSNYISYHDNTAKDFREVLVTNY